MKRNIKNGWGCNRKSLLKESDKAQNTSTNKSNYLTFEFFSPTPTPTHPSPPYFSQTFKMAYIFL
jgi:hypothetical protein